MIQVIFDRGNGMMHHVGGDYDSVEDAESYAIRAMEISPAYVSAIVTENGDVKAEVTR